MRVILALLLSGCACPGPALMTAGHAILDNDPVVMVLDAGSEIYNCERY